jgi:hypothetical protein
MTLLAFLALAAAIGSPLPQQADVESRSPARREAAAEVQRQRWIRQRFARCIVADYPRLAESVLNVPPSAGEDGLRNLLTGSPGAIERCVSLAEHRSHFGEWIGSVAISGGMRVLVGAFAEQLYVKRFRQLPAAVAAAEPASPIDDIAVRATSSFANCLIDADALAVDRLVRTPVDSDQERAAFAALSLRYGGCLDQGNALILNPSTLRAALAEQLYRRTR